MPRYYCPMRPPAPGAIPKGAVEVKSYEERHYSPTVDRMVWGWADYPLELSYDEVDEYELIREPREIECE